jgi:hypothetical protein
MMKKLLKTLQSKNQRLSVPALLFFLTACGSFQLSDSISPPAGKTNEQVQADTLACKNQSKKEANTASQKVLDPFFVMTLLGKLAANDVEDSKQREFFAKCMVGRGYKVLPSEKGKITA